MGTELGLNYGSFGNTGNQSQFGSRILARVDRVILGPLQPNGEVDKDFEANGKWASVGSIRYTIMYSSITIPNINNVLAKPYHSNNIQYPTVGEIVELVPGPSPKLNNSTLEKDLYYLVPINLWNSTHHNAFPNFYNLATYNNNVKVPYADATRGVKTAPVQQTKPIPLGQTFVEQSNIRNQQPFEGDLIYQGRQGQSIRFGSTVKNSVIKNPWSSQGNAGDPIIIISNGQAPITGTAPWIPVVEDINNDAASIYLTGGQLVILQDLNNFKLDSFLTEVKIDQVKTQPLAVAPTSTDTKSPISQSQGELKFAQVSTQVQIPSTVEQKRVTTTITPGTNTEPKQGDRRVVGLGDIQVYDAYRKIWTTESDYLSRYTVQGVPKQPNVQLPSQPSQPSILLQPPVTSSRLNIQTTFFNPNGTTTTEVVTIPYAPVSGINVNSAINQIITSSNAITVQGPATSTSTGSAESSRSKAIEQLRGDLEIITVEEESEFRFTFDIGLTETVEFGDGSEEDLTEVNIATSQDDKTPVKVTPTIVPNKTGGTGTGPTAIQPNVSNIADSRVEIAAGTWTTNNGSVLKGLSHVDGKPVCVPMIKAVLAMKDACKAETGQTLIITSGFRPPFEGISFRTKSGVQVSATSQIALCGKDGKKGCAKPGSSPHGNGIAVDTNTGTDYPIASYSSRWNPVIGEWMFKNSWKFGFVRGVKSEEWHFEYRPGNTVFSIVPRGHKTWHGVDKLIPD